MALGTNEFALYTHLEDSRFLNFKNGLWLQMKDCENLHPQAEGPQAVLVEGTFDSTAKGDDNRFSGGLVAITKCSGFVTVN